MLEKTYKGNGISFFMNKRNIIFICTDQHRVDSLWAYSKETLCKTPNLDTLSKESVVFSTAYTSCPVCTPARSSMQCGLYPSISGFETNSFQSGCRVHELPDSEILLPRRLEKLGYTPYFTGKWHLGVGADKDETEEGRSLLKAYTEQYEMDVDAYKNYGTLPTDIGYKGDDFPGHGNGGWHYPQFKEYLQKNNLDPRIEDRTSHKRPGDHSTWGEVTGGVESTIEHFLVNRSIDMLEKHKDGPFFLNLNLWGPHEPFFAPTEFLNMYKDMQIPQWKSFSEDTTLQPRIYELVRRPEVPWDFFENTLRYYYACISHIDYQIGRVISYLKHKNLYDSTMIIFSADHGDYQGSHGGMENKSYGMYDDTTRIPLYIKPPSPHYSGYTQEAPVGTCDIYATILKEAGWDISHDSFGFGQGRPLQPFIQNKNHPWSDEIVTEGLGANSILITQRMFRKGDYKYVFNGGDMDQLFHMKDDPLELNNLINDKREITKMIREAFALWLQKNTPALYPAFCRINRLREWSLDLHTQEKIS